MDLQEERERLEREIVSIKLQLDRAGVMLDVARRVGPEPRGLGIGLAVGVAIGVVGLGVMALISFSAIMGMD